MSEHSSNRNRSSNEHSEVNQTIDIVQARPHGNNTITMTESLQTVGPSASSSQDITINLSANLTY